MTRATEITTMSTEWLEHLVAVKRLRPATCWHYRKAIEPVVAHLEHRGWSRWQDVPAADLHAYLYGLHDDNRARSALRGFYRWLTGVREIQAAQGVEALLETQRGLLDRRVKVISRPWTPRKPFTEDECARMCRYLESQVERARAALKEAR